MVFCPYLGNGNDEPNQQRIFVIVRADVCKTCELYWQGVPEFREY